MPSLRQVVGRAGGVIQVANNPEWASARGLETGDESAHVTGAQNKDPHRELLLGPGRQKNRPNKFI